MINAIYGKKIGMTQIFNEDDRVVPVTVIQAEPNTICQVKTKDSDGYEAVQLGFGAIKEKKVNKPMAGHFAKQGTAPTRYLREVRVENAGEYKVGDQQTVAAFAETKKVDVTGTSKGKGFAGVMKRYGFRGGPGGHGAHFHRAPGSVGQCATPSRVFKGLKLPGHMGVDTVTVKNLEVVRIDEEQNLILVKGCLLYTSEPHLHGEERARRAERLREGSGRPGGEGGFARVLPLAGAPQSRERLRLRRPSAIRLPAAEEPRRRAVGLPAALPLHHGGRVPGHEPRPVLHHGAFGRGAQEHHGGGRR